MKAAVLIRFPPSMLCILRNGGMTGPASAASKRPFTSSKRSLATWGFIGLGRMGMLWQLDSCPLEPELSLMHVVFIRLPNGQKPASPYLRG